MRAGLWICREFGGLGAVERAASRRFGGHAFDDFGAGYSSLAYLTRLPIHEVKIDKSFVLDLRIDGDDARIARSIIDLGHNLGLVVVAEWVEDRATYERLAAMACDLAQGYYLSRPIPAADLTVWARSLLGLSAVAG